LRWKDNKIIYDKNTGEGKKKEVSVKKTWKFVLEDMLIDDIKTYSHVAFKPEDYELQPYEYNMWTGFEAKKVNVDMNLIKPFLDYLRLTICSSNDVTYKYIISWIRHICLKPWEKTDIAIFLQSIQGCGKSTLPVFLSKYVFGNHVSIKMSGTDKITGKFNTLLGNKIFVVVEEMACSGKKFHNELDKIKDLITGDKLALEPKGKEIYTIDNRCNFMMCTNNILSLKIEESDRRYACFEVSDVKKGDEKYWTWLRKKILNQKVGNHFYSYLLNMKDEDCVSLRNIPKSSLKKEMVNLSQPSPIRFMNQLKNGECKIQENMYIPPFTTKKVKYKKGINRMALYQKYRQWCESNDEKNLSKTKFYQKIQLQATRTKIRKKIVFWVNLENKVFEDIVAFDQV
jgi:hypothetical protein